MDYQEVISIIEKKRRFGNLPGAVISKKMLAAVGDPQKALSFVHIAGTNGKGSTAAFLSEICRASGIRAGLFTSPHLVSFTERIKIDGEEIPKQVVKRLGMLLLDLKLTVSPTMFDYCMAMAMLYFKEQECELVILETGLGGEYDSTNAIDAPLAAVITKIGYDHTKVLGDTLPMIAGAKAGIIKKGSIVISESQKEEASEVIAKACREKGAKLTVINQRDILPVNGGFSYKGYHSLKLRALGKYQRENAAAAIETAQKLMEKGIKFTETSIRRGIEQMIWPGRMELVLEKPFFLLDGAHNENGVDALAESLEELYPGSQFRFFMGVLAEKDYRRMAKRILPLAKEIITVTPDSSRALDGAKLAEYIRELGGRAETEGSIKKMLERLQAEDGAPSVAFGSLYFIGEIKKILSRDIPG